MHWTLTVPDEFILTQVIQRTRGLHATGIQTPGIHLPFTVELARGHLGRVERLTSGRTVALTITQASAGLVLQCNERLSDHDKEELSRRTWRMLRLNEDLAPFLALARHVPGLESTIHYGARMLRGTTLFEDVVKAIILAMGKQQADTSPADASPPDFRPSDQRHTRAGVRWIVDQFGDPLPSNPTRHAFPTPAQIVHGYELLMQTFEPIDAENLVAVSAEFHTDSRQIDAAIDNQPSLEALKAHLVSHFELNDTALRLVMLALGRYDYIPTDHEAQVHIQHHTTTEANTPATIQAMFEPWQPWGGLAFWLWDWSAGHPPYGEDTTVVWKT